ncbi:unnamed protein product, partial [Didymodactylos carnosus]
MIDSYNEKKFMEKESRSDRVVDESLLNKMVADDRLKSVMFSAQTRDMDTFIQWLGGERAVDVPDEYLLATFQHKHFVNHKKNTSVDNVEQNQNSSLSCQHHYNDVNVNAQCIELLRLRNCTEKIDNSQTMNETNSEQ